MIAEIPQGEHSTGQAGRTGQGKLKVKLIISFFICANPKPEVAIIKDRFEGSGFTVQSYTNNIDCCRTIGCHGMNNKTSFRNTRSAVLN